MCGFFCLGSPSPTFGDRRSALSEVGEFASGTLGDLLTVACTHLPLEYPLLLLGSYTVVAESRPSDGRAGKGWVRRL